MSATSYTEKLPDGSRIRRCYRVDNGEEVPTGNWQWVVYDPDRRPSRKYVNLRTKDKAVAMGKALDFARDRSLGTFDPWTSAAASGVPVSKAAEAYLDSQRRAGRAEGTVNAAKRLLSAFERSLPSACHVAHVEAEHVLRFVSAPKLGKDGKPGPPKSAGTRRRYRAVLRHFFGFCKQRGYTRTDPTAQLEAPTGRANRRDHITEAEAAAMLRKLDAAGKRRSAGAT